MNGLAGGLIVSLAILGGEWIFRKRRAANAPPSDVEQLRAVVNDQGEEMSSLRYLAIDAESRMAKMFALRDPTKVRDAAESFAEKIDDVFAGSYATTAERRARIAQIVVDLIVRTAIGESAESSIETALKDAAQKKATAEKTA